MTISLLAAFRFQEDERRKPVANLRVLWLMPGATVDDLSGGDSVGYMPIHDGCNWDSFHNRIARLKVRIAEMRDESWTGTRTFIVNDLAILALFEREECFCVFPAGEALDPMDLRELQRDQGGGEVLPFQKEDWKRLFGRTTDGT